MRLLVSSIALALIFMLGIGPFVVTAQTETSAPQTEAEIPALVAEASSTEPISAELVLVPATPAEAVPEVAPTEVIDPATYVAGEVLVKYRESRIDLTDSADQQTADALVETLDLATTETIDGQNVAVLSTEGIAVEEAIALLEANPNVEYAEPNYIRSITALSSTSPELTDLWALQNTAQTVNGVLGTLDADTDALEAWDIATGTDVIVAVIDTGVDYTHPDLASSMWDGSDCVDENGNALGGCMYGYDFEYNGLDPMATTSVGDAAHGTHVAGVIAASHNDVGIAGIAPGVKIMALRFGLDTASEVRAIDFATRNGAKIINASFGGTASSTAEYEAIQRFQNAGGIFVASAGNSTYDLDTDPTSVYPAEYELANIISVVATDQDDELAYYSNYGATSVDLGAPGSNIHSTVPVSDSVDGYEYKSGTSMAAPMVAGAVALAWSYQSALSATEVKAAVLDSGDPLDELATTTVSGNRLNVHSMLLSLAPVIPAPDTTAPVIALLGANPLTLTVGDIFTDPGAQVTDNIDATTTITGTGAVDTATAGTYVRSYAASDAAGNAATTTTRSVVVSAPVVSSGGGGGGGGSSRSSGEGGSSSAVTRAVTPEAPVTRQLFTPSPAPRVLGAATYIFSANLGMGATGAEVTELQKALTANGFYTGPVSGYFGPLTQSAVRAFQVARGLAAVGNVGPQTRAALNASAGVTPQANSTTALIFALQAQLKVLLAQLALLQAKGT